MDGMRCGEVVSVVYHLSLKHNEGGRKI